MKKINKCDLNKFVHSLTKNSTMYAPVSIDGVFLFKQVEDFQEIDPGYKNSIKSPREVFFPQSEVLFEYKKGTLLSTEKIGKKIILLGVRPCDAHAVTLLDNVFIGGDYEDVYYANKREQTIIVGLGCNKPLNSCFCALLGGGPFSTRGMDILLVDIGDSYLVDAVSDTGERVLTYGLEDATDDDLELTEKIKTEAERKIKLQFPLEIDKVKEKLDLVFNHAFWDNLSDICLGCAVCTYLCPTCHCFDIVDEAKNSQGKRVRTWDSCMFPHFTRQASGHNPKPTAKERMRQRVMHKFNYFVENYKEAACTGCGRCVMNCPVTIDIREVLQEILMI